MQTVDHPERCLIHAVLTLLVVYLTASSAINVPPPQLEEARYDCSGYYPSATKDSAAHAMNRVIRKSCPNAVGLKLYLFRVENGICTVVYQYQPDKHSVYHNSKCSEAVTTIITKLPEIAWGQMWGCVEYNLSYPITPYYAISLPLPNIQAAYLSVYTVGICHIPPLQLRTMVEAKCEMTPYGGYRWKVSLETNCSAPELHPPTTHLMNFLRLSPISCKLLTFLLYGYLKQEPIIHTEHVRQVLDRLTYSCPKFDRQTFAAIRLDFYNILDLIIYKMGDVGRHQFEDHFVLETLRELVIQFGRRLQDYFSSYIRFYHRTRYLHAHQLTPYGSVANLKCASSYDLEIKGYNGPLLVVCTELVRVTERISISDHLIYSGIVLIDMMNPWKDLTVSIVFRVSDSPATTLYTCGRLASNSTKQWSQAENCPYHEYNETTVRCVCNTPGLFAILHVSLIGTTLNVYY